MTSPTLPPRQQRVVEVIRSWNKNFHESPTCEELGRALGITKVSAHLLLKKLAARGVVVVTPRTWRGVTLIERRPAA